MLGVPVSQIYECSNFAKFSLYYHFFCSRMNIEKYVKMTNCRRYDVTGTICGITLYGVNTWMIESVMQGSATAGLYLSLHMLEILGSGDRHRICRKILSALAVESEYINPGVVFNFNFKRFTRLVAELTIRIVLEKQWKLNFAQKIT